DAGAGVGDAVGGLEGDDEGVERGGFVRPELRAADGGGEVDAQVVVLVAVASGGDVELRGECFFEYGASLGIEESGLGGDALRDGAFAGDADVDGDVEGGGGEVG